MAALVVEKGTAQGQWIRLDAEKTVLGRDAGCDLILNAPIVSRRHVQILRVNGQYLIEDLKTGPGTWVNNLHIGGPVLLKNNDQIRIGSYLLSFREKGPPGSDEDGNGS